MKLSGAKAENYLEAKSALPLTLIYGMDQARIRKMLQSYAALVLGDNASEEMRLWAYEYKELTKDPALLGDNLRATSFFPGAKGVIIYDLTDGGAKLIEEALEGWQEGDGIIFAQAGSLNKSSKLRKAFEGRDGAAVIAIYDDPMNASQLGRMIERKGLKLDQDAQALLLDFAQNYDHGGVEMFIEGLALYQNEGEVLSAEALQKLLPGRQSAAAGDIVNMMLRGEAKKLVAHLRRAPAQGISLQQINLFAIRQIMTLIGLQSSPDPRGAISQLRPPVFGPRRQMLEDNLRRWSLPKLENALVTLSEVEKETRSGHSHLPEAAYMERMFLRISMMAR